MELSRRVIAEDHRLEQEVDSSREALAKHRWHWTLDESNPRRVAIREYARTVSRHERTIRDMATGYQDWLAETAGGAPRGRLMDYLERAKLRGDTLVAAEAVAAARNVTLGTARRHHAQEIQAVKHNARTAAEHSGKPVEVAAQEAAEFHQKASIARSLQAERHKAEHTLEYINFEHHLDFIERRLKQALKDSEGVQFIEEELDLLRHTIAKLRGLLELVSMRVNGEPNVDWDAELAKLGGSS